MPITKDKVSLYKVTFIMKPTKKLLSSERNNPPHVNLYIMFMRYVKRIARILYYKRLINKQGFNAVIQCRRQYVTELASPIKGFYKALYVEMYYIGNAQIVSQLDKLFLRDKVILRSITQKVLLDDILPKL